MAKAPTSVMVVSILGIIYGGLMLLCLPVNIIMMITPLMPNPVLDALRHDQTYVAIYLATNAISLFLGVLLLASAIGSLKLKAWGRTGMNMYAVAHIVMAVVGTVVNVVWVFPATKKAMEGNPAGEMGLISGIAGAVLGLLFALAVAAVILIVFNRRVAVDAFKGIFPQEAEEFPGGTV